MAELNNEYDLYRLIEAICSALDYGPDWIFDASLAGQSITIRWRVKDIHGHGHTWLMCMVPINSYLLMDAAAIGSPGEFILRQIYEGIERLEGHERLERLKLNGVTIWDPHPQGNGGRLLCAPEGPPRIPLDY